MELKFVITQQVCPTCRAPLEVRSDCVGFHYLYCAPCKQRKFKWRVREVRP